MKRLKDNIATIVLIITIICCTVCICNKLNDLSYIKEKADRIETKIQSIGRDVDKISDHTNMIRNIEDYTHKIYKNMY